jgi:hypothetical protein
MSLTNKPTIRLAAVYAAIRDCMAGALTADRGWHAVTIGTDGVPVYRVEPERRVSTEEYFGRGDRYPVTVFSTLGGGPLSSDAAAEALAGFDPRQQFDGLGGEGELVRKLTAAGYKVD